VQNELFPEPSAPFSPALGAALEYVRSLSGRVTSTEAAQLKKLNKGKKIIFDPKKPKKLTVFVARTFPEWQDKYVELVREHFDAMEVTVDDKKLLTQVPKPEMKKAMPFIQHLKSRLVFDKESPDVVFNRKLGFDEVETLKEVLPAIKRTTGCQVIELLVVQDAGKKVVLVLGENAGKVLDNSNPIAESAVPGAPSFAFENVEEEGGVKA